MSIEQRLAFVEVVLKEQGQMLAGAIARCTALGRILVEKGVCTWDDLNIAEGTALRDFIESTKPKAVVDPPLEPIIKPN